MEHRTDDARLSRLIEMLWPRDLVQRVRGQVLTSRGGHVDIDEVEANNADGIDITMEQKKI